MSKNKTFVARKIALTCANEDILKLWSTINARNLPQDTTINIDYKFEETDIKQQNGHMNSGLNWVASTCNIHIDDRGRQTTIPSQANYMNSHSREFFSEFEKDLITGFNSLGYDGSVNDDIIYDHALLTEHVGLIQEILLRIIAQIFDENGNPDSRKRYMNIFKEFNTGLTTLEHIAHESGNVRSFAGQLKLMPPIPSKSILALSNIINVWYPKIYEMCEFINLINKADDIIFEKSSFVKALKIGIQKCLYYNLMKICRKQNDIKLANMSAAQPKYLEIELEAIEYTILAKGEKRFEKSIISNDTLIEKGEKVLAAALNKYNNIDEKQIHTLYYTLQTLISIEKILNEVESLKKYLGYVLFVSDRFGVEKLDYCINKYINQAEEVFKEVPKEGQLAISVTKDPLPTVNLNFKPTANFRSLSELDFIKAIANECELSICKINHECTILDEASIWPNISFNKTATDKIAAKDYVKTRTTHTEIEISELPTEIPLAQIEVPQPQVYDIEDSVSLEERLDTKFLYDTNSPISSSEPIPNNYQIQLNSQKRLGLIDVDQYISYVNIENNEYIKFKLDTQLVNSHSLFIVLGIDYKLTMENLYLQLEGNNDKLNKIVAEEAHYLSLGYGIPPVLDPILDRNLNECDLFKYRNSLAIYFAIRTEFCRDLKLYYSTNNVVRADYLKLDDFHLSQYVCEKENIIPEKLKKNYIDYIRSKDEYSKCLNMIFSHSKILLNYFDTRYIKGSEDFIYIPGKIEGMLRAVLSLYDIPVQVWHKGANNKLLRVNHFNVDINNKFIINDLLCVANTNFNPALFYKMQRQEIRNEIIKTNLYEILFKIIEDKTLPIDQKISILNYFCVEDKEIAATGIKAKLDKILNIEKEIKSLSNKTCKTISILKQGVTNEKISEEDTHKSIQLLALGKLDLETFNDLNLDINKKNVVFKLDQERKKIWKKLNPSLKEQVKYFKDCAILIDEPLDNKKRTMLTVAVEQENQELIEFLISAGASVSTRKVSDFNILINVRCSDKEYIKAPANTYILDILKNGTKGKYRLTYQTCDNSPRYKIEAEVVKKDLIESAIRAFYRGSNQDNIILENAIRDAVKDYHYNTSLESPLTIGAKKIGLSSSKTEIFFSLLDQGLLEVEKHVSNIVMGPFLKSLSDKLKVKFLVHFSTYIEKLKKDNKSKFQQIIRQALQFFGLDRSHDRAIELATFIQLLIETQATGDYHTLLSKYKKICGNAKQTVFSLLIKEVATVVEEQIQHIKEKIDIYSEELKSYTTSLIGVSFTESYEARLKIMQNSIQNSDKKRELMQEELRVMKSQREEESRKIQEAEQKRDAQFKQKMQELQAKCDDTIKVDCPNTAVGKNLENNASKLPMKIDGTFDLPRDILSFLVNKNLSPTHKSKDFFIVVANELNRVKPSEVMWSTENLRRNCCTYYGANMKFVRKINLLLVNNSPVSDCKRVDSYGSIYKNEGRIIEGVTCVEGMILCNSLGIKAIYLITIGNNQIKYEVATAEKYTIISDNSEIALAEIAQNIDSCPVITLYDGEYLYKPYDPNIRDLSQDSISEDTNSLESYNFQDDTIFEYEAPLDEKCDVNTQYQYEDNDIQVILNARLAQYELDIKRLALKMCVLAPTHDIDTLFDYIHHNINLQLNEQIMLIPYNLDNMHWVGMFLRFKRGELIEAKYADSYFFLYGRYFDSIKTAFNERFKCEMENILVIQQQDSVSCGVYVIENLIYLALNKGLTQLPQVNLMREQHLKCLKAHNLPFYNNSNKNKGFYERQLNNICTVLSKAEQYALANPREPICQAINEKNENIIYQYNTAKRKISHIEILSPCEEFKVNNTKINCIELLSGDDGLACSSEDGSIVIAKKNIWSSGYKIVNTLQHPGPLKGHCLQQLGRDRLISCGGDSIIQWNLNSTDPKKQVYQHENVVCVLPLKDSKYFASCSLGGVLKIWENNGQVRYVNNFNELGNISFMKQLSDHSLVIGGNNKNIQILIIEEGKVKETHTIELSIHLVNCIKTLKDINSTGISKWSDFRHGLLNNIPEIEEIMYVNYLTDNVLLIGSINGKIQIFDSRNYTYIKELELGNFDIACMHLLSDSKLIASAHSNIRMWDLGEILSPIINKPAISKLFAF